MSSRRALFFLGIAVSLVFLWLALRSTNLREIADSLAQARWAFCLPFLVSLFAFYWLKSSRWGTLLQPVRAIPTRRLFPVVMIGYAGNTVLPMNLGELLRTFVASREFSLRQSTVLASIALERMFDLLIIFVLVGLALTTDARLAPAVVAAGYSVALLAIGGLVFLALLAYRTDAVLRVVGTLLARLPAVVRSKVSDLLTTSVDGLATLKHPRLFAQVGVSSLVQWGFVCVCTWLSLIALNIDVPPSAALVVLACVIVSVTLPTSPGFIGSIQFAYTLGLSAYGIEPAAAFAASVFYHVLAYLSVAVVGFFFLYRWGYRFSSLQREIESG